MDLGSQDEVSLAAKFVDIHGMRRGMDQDRTAIPKPNKAALGKFRRLMSLCIYPLK